MIQIHVPPHSSAKEKDSIPGADNDDFIDVGGAEAETGGPGIGGMGRYYARALAYDR